jgi:hypothetical protein
MAMTIEEDDLAIAICSSVRLGPGARMIAVFPVQSGHLGLVVSVVSNDFRSPSSDSIFSGLLGNRLADDVVSGLEWDPLLAGAGPYEVP